MFKRILIITSLVLVLTLALGLEPAKANGGPHGGYTATTDACAGCHRAHTATGPRLLIDASTQALCLTCHGAGATGATTDVENGIWTTTTNALLGGQFNSGATTSKHDVTSTVLAAWGNAADRGSTADLAEGLDCGSCHDPHGTAGYRLLRWGPTTAGTDYDSAAKDYDSESWGDPGANDLSDFCANCHSSYLETAAAVGSSEAAQARNNATTNFTHRVDMVWNTPLAGVTFGANHPETLGYDGTGGTGDELPLSTSGNALCVSCHFPHGTAATATGNSVDAGPAASSSTEESALLRLDERGVCQACHQK